MSIRKILSFLKPSAAGISLFLISWVVFYLAFIFMLKGCVSADCRSFQGESIPCCGQAMTAMAYFFYNYRVLFLVLTYLFFCWLSVNLESPGTISNRAKQL